MPTKTLVKAVTVTAKCHAPLQQPKEGVTSAGKSEISWKFVGVYLANNQCVVVVQAGKSRDGKGSKVNKAGSGGAFPEGKDGLFCELTLDHGNLDLWTVSVATDKDVVVGDDMILRGGTGMIGR